MTQESPMGYFIQTGRHSGGLQISLDSVYSRFDELNNDIESIIGLPNVKNKLRQWNKRHLIASIRKRSGVRDLRLLPEILITSGIGAQSTALGHVAQFCKKIGIFSREKIHYYNVNKLVTCHVIDTKQSIEEAFKEASSNIIDFHGFNKLIENPRPPIADWHDWVDIIINYILDYIDKFDYKHPVSLSMSQANFNYLKERFPRLKRFKIEQIYCHYKKSHELSLVCLQSLKSKNLIISVAAKQQIDELFLRIFADKEYRNISEFDITTMVVDTVMERQSRRLDKLLTHSMSRRKIKKFRNQIFQSIFLLLRINSFFINQIHAILLIDKGKMKHV